jgi:hypothetical protein
VKDLTLDCMMSRKIVVPFVGEEQLNVSPTVAARRYCSALIY